MLELLPDGKTFQKLNATQTKALDRYYIRLRKTNQEDPIKTAVDNLPIVIGAGMLAGAYIFRETIKEEAEEAWEKFKIEALDATGGATYNVLDFAISFFRPSSELWTGKPAEPESPAEVVLADGQTVTLTQCERYNNDIVDLYGSIPTSGLFLRTRRMLHGLTINDKLDTMKKAGCTKPAGVTQRDWDKAT